MTLSPSAAADRAWPARLAVAATAVLLIALGVAALPPTPAGAVTSHNPFGSVDSLQLTAQGITAVGWAADADAPTTSPFVALTVNNVTMAGGTATGSRPDVAAAYPGYGPAHGYTLTAVVKAGTWTVCVRIRNIGPGGNVTLTCQSITVVDNPAGFLDSIRATPTGVSVAGWTADNNAPTTPLTVEVRSDNALITTTTADGSRPDVAQANPSYGPNHGFALTTPLPSGAHTVCVWADNVGAGMTAPLGCAAVTVVHNPIGTVNSIVQSPSGVTAVGWAADGDAPTSALVTALQVDGATRALTLARLTRPDVAHAYPSYGAAHGFSFGTRIPAGPHLVCVIARNAGAGVDTPIGCVNLLVTDNPIGSITSVSGARAGHVTVTGVAGDPDTSAPITVTVAAADGTPVTVPANGPGGAFTATVPAAQGNHLVCAAGNNVGPGQNAVLGCLPYTLDDSPVGTLYRVTQARSGIQVSGWAGDPDASGPITVQIVADGTSVLGTAVANGAGGVHNGHELTATFPYGSGGVHTFCLIGINAGFGANRAVGCAQAALDYRPQLTLAPPTRTVPSSPVSGALVSGWAFDPDSQLPITVQVSVDGGAPITVRADQPGLLHNGRNFSVAVPAGQGTHTICAVAVNVGPGTNAAPVCAPVTLDFTPFGHLDTTTRSATGASVTATGWALDPSTAGPIGVVMSIDGVLVAQGTASVNRPDVAHAYPGWGANHGYSLSAAAGPGEHRLCVAAKNVGSGSDALLGCTIVDATHPTPASVPTNVTAIGGFGGATISWTAPASDGGAPWQHYTVRSVPDGISVLVDPSTTSAVITGLRPRTSYRFTVTTTNVAGTSHQGVSPAVVTQAAPPSQSTPAPVSTSRYTRNITSAAAGDLNAMRAEGIADARANPSGHGYLVLLDIGGQDQADGGVVLSAGVRFVSYPELVANVEAYVAGYASAQRPSAPVTIAIGTNNDMDVSNASGATWARSVVNPVVSFARGWTGITVAGADDMEPGFSAGYPESRAWLSGYLAGTSAPFVFNGSADGCAWTQSGTSCNNGWTMAGLYQLAGGAAPTRIINLPQIYNTTMAAQWRYISLTGVSGGRPRINFGGPLTEYTACVQTSSCGSLTGNEAWSALWSELNASASLRIGSLPYSTDLRIDP